MLCENSVSLIHQAVQPRCVRCTMLKSVYMVLGCVCVRCTMLKCVRTVLRCMCVRCTMAMCACTVLMCELHYVDVCVRVPAADVCG